MGLIFPYCQVWAIVMLCLGCSQRRWPPVAFLSRSPRRFGTVWRIFSGRKEADSWSIFACPLGQASCWTSGIHCCSQLLQVLLIYFSYRLYCFTDFKFYHATYLCCTGMSFHNTYSVCPNGLTCHHSFVNTGCFSAKYADMSPSVSK